MNGHTTMARSTVTRSPSLLGSIGSPKGASPGRQERLLLPASPRPRSSRTSPANSEPQFPLSSPHSFLHRTGPLSEAEDPPTYDSVHLPLQQSLHASPTNVYYSSRTRRSPKDSPSSAVSSSFSTGASQGKHTSYRETIAARSAHFSDMTSDITNTISLGVYSNVGKDLLGRSPLREGVVAGSTAVSRRTEKEGQQLRGQETANASPSSPTRQHIASSPHLEEANLKSSVLLENQENFRLLASRPFSCLSGFTQPPSPSHASSRGSSSHSLSRHVASPYRRQVSLEREASPLSTQRQNVYSSSPLTSSPLTDKTPDKRNSTASASRHPQQERNTRGRPPVHAQSPYQDRPSPRKNDLDAMMSSPLPSKSFSSSLRSIERNSLRRISVTSAASGAQETSLFRDPLSTAHSTKKRSPLHNLLESSSSSPHRSSPPATSPPPEPLPQLSSQHVGSPLSLESSPLPGVCTTPERGHRRRFSPPSSFSQQEEPSANLPDPRTSMGTHTPAGILQESPVRCSSSYSFSLQETSQDPVTLSQPRQHVHEDTIEDQSCRSVEYSVRSRRSLLSFSTGSSPLLRSPSPRSGRNPRPLPSLSVSVSTPLSQCLSSSSLHGNHTSPLSREPTPHSPSHQPSSSHNPLPSASSSLSPIRVSPQPHQPSHSSSTTQSSSVAERRVPGGTHHIPRSLSSPSSSSPSSSPVKQTHVSEVASRDEPTGVDAETEGGPTRIRSHNYVNPSARLSSSEGMAPSIPPSAGFSTHHRLPESGRGSPIKLGGRRTSRPSTGDREFVVDSSEMAPPNETTVKEKEDWEKKKEEEEASSSSSDQRHKAFLKEIDVCESGGDTLGERGSARSLSSTATGRKEEREDSRGEDTRLGIDVKHGDHAVLGRTHPSSQVERREEEVHKSFPSGDKPSSDVWKVVSSTQQSQIGDKEEEEKEIEVSKEKKEEKKNKTKTNEEQQPSFKTIPSEKEERERKEEARKKRTNEENADESSLSPSFLRCTSLHDTTSPFALERREEGRKAEREDVDSRGQGQSETLLTSSSESRPEVSSPLPAFPSFVANREADQQSKKTDQEWADRKEEEEMHVRLQKDMERRGKSLIKSTREEMKKTDLLVPHGEDSGEGEEQEDKEKEETSEREKGEMMASEREDSFSMRRGQDQIKDRRALSTSITMAPATAPTASKSYTSQEGRSEDQMREEDEETKKGHAFVASSSSSLSFSFDSVGETHEDVFHDVVEGSIDDSTAVDTLQSRSSYDWSSRRLSQDKQGEDTNQAAVPSNDRGVHTPPQAESLEESDERGEDTIRPPATTSSHLSTQDNYRRTDSEHERVPSPAFLLRERNGEKDTISFPDGQAYEGVESPIGEKERTEGNSHLSPQVNRAAPLHLDATWARTTGDIKLLENEEQQKNVVAPTATSDSSVSSPRKISSKEREEKEKKTISSRPVYLHQHQGASMTMRSMVEDATSQEDGVREGEEESRRKPSVCNSKEVEVDENDGKPPAIAPASVLSVSIVSSSLVSVGASSSPLPPPLVSPSLPREDDQLLDLRNRRRRHHHAAGAIEGTSSSSLPSPPLALPLLSPGFGVGSTTSSSSASSTSSSFAPANPSSLRDACPLKPVVLLSRTSASFPESIESLEKAPCEVDCTTKASTRTTTAVATSAQPGGDSSSSLSHDSHQTHSPSSCMASSSSSSSLSLAPSHPSGESQENKRRLSAGLEMSLDMHREDPPFQRRGEDVFSAHHTEDVSPSHHSNLRAIHSPKLLQNTTGSPSKKDTPRPLRDPSSSPSDEAISPPASSTQLFSSSSSLHTHYLSSSTPSSSSDSTLDRPPSASSCIPPSLPLEQESLSSPGRSSIMMKVSTTASSPSKLLFSIPPLPPPMVQPASIQQASSSSCSPALPPRHPPPKSLPSCPSPMLLGAQGRYERSRTAEVEEACDSAEIAAQRAARIADEVAASVYSGDIGRGRKKGREGRQEEEEGEGDKLSPSSMLAMKKPKTSETQPKQIPSVALAQEAEGPCSSGGILDKGDVKNNTDYKEGSHQKTLKDSSRDLLSSSLPSLPSPSSLAQPQRPAVESVVYRLSSSSSSSSSASSSPGVNSREEEKAVEEKRHHAVEQEREEMQKEREMRNNGSSSSLSSSSSSRILQPSEDRRGEEQTDDYQRPPRYSTSIVQGSAMRASPSVNKPEIQPREDKTLTSAVLHSHESSKGSLLQQHLPLLSSTSSLSPVVDPPHVKSTSTAARRRSLSSFSSSSPPPPHDLLTIDSSSSSSSSLLLVSRPINRDLRENREESSQELPGDKNISAFSASASSSAEDETEQSLCLSSSTSSLLLPFNISEESQSSSSFSAATVIDPSLNPPASSSSSAQLTTSSSSSAKTPRATPQPPHQSHLASPSHPSEHFSSYHLPPLDPSPLPHRLPSSPRENSYKEISSSSSSVFPSPLPPPRPSAISASPVPAASPSSSPSSSSSSSSSPPSPFAAPDPLSGDVPLSPRLTFITEDGSTRLGTAPAFESYLNHVRARLLMCGEERRESKVGDGQCVSEDNLQTVSGRRRGEGALREDGHRGVAEQNQEDQGKEEEEEIERSSDRRRGEKEIGQQEKEKGDGEEEEEEREKVLMDVYRGQRGDGNPTQVIHHLDSQDREEMKEREEEEEERRTRVTSRDEHVIGEDRSSPLREDIRVEREERSQPSRYEVGRDAERRHILVGDEEQQVGEQEEEGKCGMLSHHEGRGSHEEGLSLIRPSQEEEERRRDQAYTSEDKNENPHCEVIGEKEQGEQDEETIKEKSGSYFPVSLPSSLPLEQYHTGDRSNVIRKKSGEVSIGKMYRADRQIPLHENLSMGKEIPALENRTEEEEEKKERSPRSGTDDDRDTPRRQRRMDKAEDVHPRDETEVVQVGEVHEEDGDNRQEKGIEEERKHRLTSQSPQRKEDHRESRGREDKEDVEENSHTSFSSSPPRRISNNRMPEGEEEQANEGVEEGEEEEEGGRKQLLTLSEFLSLTRSSSLSSLAAARHSTGKPIEEGSSFLMRETALSSLPLHSSSSTSLPYPHTTPPPGLRGEASWKKEMEHMAASWARRYFDAHVDAATTTDSGPRDKEEESKEEEKSERKEKMKSFSEWKEIFDETLQGYYRTQSKLYHTATQLCEASTMFLNAALPCPSRSEDLHRFADIPWGDEISSAVEKREKLLQEKAERRERQKQEIDRLRAELEQTEVEIEGMQSELYHFDDSSANEEDLQLLAEIRRKQGIVCGFEQMSNMEILTFNRHGLIVSLSWPISPLPSSISSSLSSYRSTYLQSQHKKDKKKPPHKGRVYIPTSSLFSSSSSSSSSCSSTYDGEKTPSVPCNLSSSSSSSSSSSFSSSLVTNDQSKRDVIEREKIRERKKLRGGGGEEESQGRKEREERDKETEEKEEGLLKKSEGASRAPPLLASRYCHHPNQDLSSSSLFSLPKILSSSSSLLSPSLKRLDTSLANFPLAIFASLSSTRGGRTHVGDSPSTFRPMDRLPIYSSIFAHLFENPSSPKEEEEEREEGPRLLSHLHFDAGRLPSQLSNLKEEEEKRKKKRERSFSSRHDRHLAWPPPTTLSILWRDPLPSSSLSLSLTKTRSLERNDKEDRREEEQLQNAKKKEQMRDQTSSSKNSEPQEKTRQENKEKEEEEERGGRILRIVKPGRNSLLKKHDLRHSTSHSPRQIDSLASKFFPPLHNFSFRSSMKPLSNSEDLTRRTNERNFTARKEKPPRSSQEEDEEDSTPSRGPRSTPFLSQSQSSLHPRPLHACPSPFSRDKEREEKKATTKNGEDLEDERKAFAEVYSVRMVTQFPFLLSGFDQEEKERDERFQKRRRSRRTLTARRRTRRNEEEEEDGRKGEERGERRRRRKSVDVLNERRDSPFPSSSSFSFRFRNLSIQDRWKAQLDLFRRELTRLAQEDLLHLLMKLQPSLDLSSSSSALIEDFVEEEKPFSPSPPVLGSSPVKRKEDYPFQPNIPSSSSSLAASPPSSSSAASHDGRSSVCTLGRSSVSSSRDVFSSNFSSSSSSFSSPSCQKTSPQGLAKNNTHLDDSSALRVTGTEDFSQDGENEEDKFAKGKGRKDNGRTEEEVYESHQQKRQEESKPLHYFPDMCSVRTLLLHGHTAMGHIAVLHDQLMLVLQRFTTLTEISYVFSEGRKGRGLDGEKNGERSIRMKGSAGDFYEENVVEGREGERDEHEEAVGGVRPREECEKRGRRTWEEENDKEEKEDEKEVQAEEEEEVHIHFRSVVTPQDPEMPSLWINLHIGIEPVDDEDKDLPDTKEACSHLQETLDTQLTHLLSQERTSPLTSEKIFADEAFLLWILDAVVECSYDRLLWLDDPAQSIHGRRGEEGAFAFSVFFKAPLAVETLFRGMMSRSEEEKKEKGGRKKALASHGQEEESDPLKYKDMLDMTETSTQKEAAQVSSSVVLEEKIGEGDQSITREGKRRRSLSPREVSFGNLPSVERNKRVRVAQD
ncbi:hypothetical protein CSUI_002428 [Cystoisospora suis]|uniref:Uncharacterized protein n=1 Tax=Cystoisospora suis TaxID=483139 RepID=A0A2C6L9J2_9APIC|nr:hypothetical protein CSUI_002428 [Cystoisospora suis]